MRVRAQSDSGDYTFGRGQGNFLVNSAAMVAQLIETGLRLVEGEWFLDTLAGTPWGDIVGMRRANVTDLILQAQILSTPGVAQNGIQKYSSNFDGTTRLLTVQAQVLTVYSTVPITLGPLQLGGSFILGQSVLGGGDVLGP